MALNRNNRQKARSAFFGNNSGLETSKYSQSRQDGLHGTQGNIEEVIIHVSSEICSSQLLVWAVNVDKLTGMTESEHHSYSDTVDAIIKECDKNYRIIATHGEPLMAFKLASVIHEKGKKVIFVDADVSEEIFLAKYKLGKNLKGFTDYFQEDEAIHDLVCKTNRKNLDIIFTGETQEFDKADILDSEFSDFRDCLVEQYDYVIVHTGDNYDIAAKCDASVILLKQSDYSEMSAESKVDFLDSNGCFVLGLVVEE